MLGSAVARLRPPEERDVDFFSTLRNDVDLQLSLMALPRASSAERVRAWLSARCDDPEGLFFVIADPATDSAAGFIQLTHMDPIHGTAELGIGLGPEHRGKGLAREALRLLEGYARAVFATRKITLRVLADNERAVALYARAGYRHVGVLEQHHYQRGAYRDVLIMEKRLA